MIMMTGKVFASLLLACLPWLAMAQSNDDLYFIPKKEKKTETKENTSYLSSLEVTRATATTRDLSYIKAILLRRVMLLQTVHLQKMVKSLSVRTHLLVS